MSLLLEYMYRGSIAVKQFELEEILSAASALKIRGLTLFFLKHNIFITHKFFLAYLSDQKRLLGTIRIMIKTLIFFQIVY